MSAPAVRAEVQYLINGKEVPAEHWLECEPNFDERSSVVSHFPNVREKVLRIILSGVMRG